MIENIQPTLRVLEMTLPCHVCSYRGGRPGGVLYAPAGVDNVHEIRIISTYLKKTMANVHK